MPSRSGPPEAEWCGAQRTQPLADHGISPRETSLAQLFQEPHGGQVGISAQQILDERLKRIETAGPSPNGRAVMTGALGFDLFQHLAYSVPGQSQLASNLSDRRTSSPTADDFIALGLGHERGVLPSCLPQEWPRYEHREPAGKRLASAPNDRRVSTRRDPDFGARPPCGPGRPARR